MKLGITNNPPFSKQQLDKILGYPISEKEFNPFWQFFELVKPYGLILGEIFVASLFIQIFGLITPIFTQLTKNLY